MHVQHPPYGETKLVRCTSGAIYDVVVDMRKDSKTRGRWLAFNLTAGNRRQLYIPEGVAHGFQTLADDTEVHYLISAFHVPAAGHGFVFSDPDIGIEWPLPVSVISDKDRNLGPFR